jgi:hypothetical protein
LKKIPTLFVRDHSQPRAPITREHHPDALWVAASEGFATRKYDGTAALVEAHHLFKRYTLKPEQNLSRQVRAGFIPIETDPETGITVGWVPVDLTSKDDKWYAEAVAEYPLDTLADGTYELIGPKVQGNPEDTDLHELVAHADAERFYDVPTDFDGLREWLGRSAGAALARAEPDRLDLTGRDIEGVVWHHPDGRMAKIKLKDFGLKRS